MKKLGKVNLIFCLIGFASLIIYIVFGILLSADKYFEYFGAYYTPTCRVDNTMFYSENCESCESHITETGTLISRKDTSEFEEFSDVFDSFGDYTKKKGSVSWKVAIFGFNIVADLIAMSLLIHFKRKQRRHI